MSDNRRSSRRVPDMVRQERIAAMEGLERETGNRRGSFKKMAELDKQRVLNLLNRILEAELAGVVRYTHYSFLVFGHNRIPIVSWLREQAAESLTHAQQAGEMITLLGAYPSLTIGPLLDSHKHDVDAIMRESLDNEAKALGLYRELLQCAEGRSVIIEEYARQMVYAEELHASEVDKMLRKPGEVAAFRPSRGAA
jgi:bacterioferritin